MYCSATHQIPYDENNFENICFVLFCFPTDVCKHCCDGCDLKHTHTQITNEWGVCGGKEELISLQRKLAYNSSMNAVDTADSGNLWIRMR